LSPLRVNNFMMHGTEGYSILRDKWVDWVNEHQGKLNCSLENGWGFGKVTHYSWNVGDELIRVSVDKWIYSILLPDSSGFIGFEEGLKPDGCLLLDAYGKERRRLTVPWELTRRDVPKQAEMWFRNIDGPYDNPITGEKGEFGVSAWIEYAGDYYFELDYHAGKFLWGKPIRF